MVEKECHRDPPVPLFMLPFSPVEVLFGLFSKLIELYEIVNNSPVELPWTGVQECGETVPLGG